MQRNVADDVADDVAVHLVHECGELVRARDEACGRAGAMRRIPIFARSLDERDEPVEVTVSTGANPHAASLARDASATRGKTDAVGRSTVDLVEYLPAWPYAFRREEVELRRAFGPCALAIEHIGSTALPGLVAKPTIDIAVGVPSMGDVDRCRPAVEALGYEFRGGFHEHHLMARKIVEDERTHHLHTRVHPSDEFDEWILFRDLLRRDPGARAAYSAEKRRLAVRFYDDRGAYVEAKTNIVRRLVEKARAERAARLDT